MKIYHESGINKGRVIDPNVAHEMASVEDRIQSDPHIRPSRKKALGNVAAEKKGAEIKHQIEQQLEQHQINGGQKKVDKSEPLTIEQRQRQEAIAKRVKVWEAGYGKNWDINTAREEQLIPLLEAALEKTYTTLETLEEDITFINREVTRRTPDEFEQLTKGGLIYSHTPAKLKSVNVDGKPVDIYINIGVFPNQKTRKYFNLFIGNAIHGLKNWARTEAVALRIDNKGAYAKPDSIAPNGYFVEGGQKIPIIGRDTTINGGVYFGGSEREAIVVNDAEDHILEKFYQETLAKLTEILRIKGSMDTQELLDAIFGLVRQAMPYNDPVVAQLAKKFAGDQKILLGNYLKERAGVCRHQALLTGYIIERLIKERYSEGHVSIDRNELAYAGAHAWVRYINKKGQIYIIDPAQNYCGKLEDVKNKKNAWSYKRPGEK